MKQIIWKLISGIFILTATMGLSVAADYPSQPITLIVPYGPGGGTDIIGRVISQVLPTYTKTPVVVVNRPGATGTVGTEDVKQAAADGYTMLLNDSGAMSVKPLTSKLPYSREDFSVVASINETPFILTVAKDRPYKTMHEFVEYARENPDKVTFATAGIGSPFHIAMEEIADVAGIKVKHIPAPGTGDAVTMVAGGHVDAVVSYPNAVLTQIEAGMIVPLGISSEGRTDQLKDVPTFTESGVDYVGRGWKAIFVRSSVPEDRRKTLESAIFEMGKDPDFVSLMEKSGETVVVRSGAEFTKIWNDEFARFDKILKKTGMIK